MDPAPSISVITPCLNRAATIAAAIESVDACGMAPSEHIVVDGGSTDGTLEVLRRYPHLTVISERDGGLYDALNKGIRRASGSILCFLNSDDLFAPNALRLAVAAFTEDSTAIALCGGIEVFAEENGDRRILTRVNDARIKQLRERDVVSGLTLTNARFFRRDVFARIGLFDTRFPIAADRDWLMRLLLAGIATKPLRNVVYQYRSHAGSLTFGIEAAARERCLREYLALAVTRLHEEPAGTHSWLAYRRWRAWAAGYLAFYLAGRNRWPESVTIAAEAMRDDPTLPARFAWQAAAHRRERRLRQWSRE